MLTTQGETSEASILDRISMARGTKEPVSAEPTEEPGAVDVSVEAPEEAESEEALAPEASEDVEPEEEEGVIESSDPVDDGAEELYIDLDGEEASLSDVKEWKQGHLRQSDYTRKTQDLADQRKEFEAEKEGLTTERQKLSNQVATLEAIISEETLSAEDVAELREYDPEAYIEHQEKMEKRKSALADAKTSNVPASNVNVEAERQKLWDKNPSWLEGGKTTKAFTDDMNMLNDYAAKNGYGNEEIQAVVSSHHWETLLKAARYDQLSKKNASIEKRVRKAAVTTKPRQAAQSSVQSQIDKAKARLKETGKAEDAVKLRQLQRKLNG